MESDPAFREQNLQLAAYQTIENSQMAVDYFLSELDPDKLLQNQGRFFLFFYGFLQALVNQQNCVLTLYRHFKKSQLELTDEIVNIRNIRNQACGHPSSFRTESGHKFVYMTETYVTTDRQFGYMTLGDDDDVDELVYFDPVSLAKTNRKFVDRVLEEINPNKADAGNGK